MNEQSSKKIVFNKSTLLSLKAELLKKQEEVNEKKQLPQNKPENFRPLPAKTSDKNEKNANTIQKKSFKDNLKGIDVEEIEACRKVKLALEKKAELYEHLSDSAGKSQLASQFLVDFDTKKQLEHERQYAVKDVNEVSNSDDEDHSEWTEFTDCLGRTRKCLKSDLTLYKKRDKELMRTMNIVDLNKGNGTDVSKESEKPVLVQKTNDYLQSLREKWEQKERELLAKDQDIHYQDLLFDEARMHGVSYYSFSTKEAERRKQMEELMKMRQETLRAQQKAEEERRKQEELLAARAAAARARERLKAGLPPEDPEVAENKKNLVTSLLELLSQQKNEADAKAKEEENKIREEQEKERQKLRDAYVREWDIGKKGVEEKLKKFREMTQEEYVEQQRAKRIDEFAPPQVSTNDKYNKFFDDKGCVISSDNNRAMEPAQTANKTWSDVRPQAAGPPPPDISDISELSEQRGLYFSTAKKPEFNSTVKYKNFVKCDEPTPIENELSDDECSTDNKNKLKRKVESNHTEFAPPPTYEYYGPTPKHSRPLKPFVSDMTEAYAQGAKRLEFKTNDRQLPKRYDFTFD